MGGIATLRGQATHRSVIDLLALAVDLPLHVVDLLLELRPDSHGQIALSIRANHAEEQHQEEAASKRRSKAHGHDVGSLPWRLP
jgi:hypothetical protein